MIVILNFFNITNKSIKKTKLQLRKYRYSETERFFCIKKQVASVICLKIYVCEITNLFTKIKEMEHYYKIYRWGQLKSEQLTHLYCWHLL